MQSSKQEQNHEMCELVQKFKLELPSVVNCVVMQAWMFVKAMPYVEADKFIVGVALKKAHSTLFEAWVYYLSKDPTFSFAETTKWVDVWNIFSLDNDVTFEKDVMLNLFLTNRTAFDEVQLTMLMIAANKIATEEATNTPQFVASIIHAVLRWKLKYNLENDAWEETNEGGLISVHSSRSILHYLDEVVYSHILLKTLTCMTMCKKCDISDISRMASFAERCLKDGGFREEVIACFKKLFLSH